MSTDSEDEETAGEIDEDAWLRGSEGQPPLLIF
jgi:hypothetical protein